MDLMFCSSLCGKRALQLQRRSLSSVVATCQNRHAYLYRYRSVDGTQPAHHNLPVTVALHDRYSAFRTKHGVGFFSTTTVDSKEGRTGSTTKNDTNQVDDDHDATYFSQYLGTQKQLEELIQAEELAKSTKMFDAWQKQQQNDDDTQSDNPQRSTGIAVVRTLARETKRQHLDDNGGGNNQRNVLEAQRDKFLHQAADIERNPLALLQLGHQKLKTESDTEAAMDYYRQAGALGSSEAWFHLGNCSWDRDETAALDCFRTAADMGHWDAMYCLGVHVLGTAENDDEEASSTAERIDTLQSALAYVEQAASAAHHGPSLHYLALFYRNGFPPLGIAPDDAPQAFVDRLNLACDYDTSGDALFLRGSCRCENDCYATDLALALDDFLKATALGHADAAVSAGALLHRGVPGSIPCDPHQAFQLYQQAGEWGNREGWRNVVACYATGEGVPQSLSMAKYIAELMLREEEVADETTR